MDDTWEEIVGEDKPTAKTLFKLIAKEGRVTAEDARQLLGADRTEVDAWVRLLLEKRYVIAEGIASNPTLRLSDDIIAKTDERAWGVGQRLGGGVSPAIRELERERQIRTQLEEALKDKEHIMEGLQDELLTEKKERAYLEEKVRFMETKIEGKATLDAAEMAAQLSRERAERAKLEELLRKKQDEPDRITTSAKPPAEAPKLEESPGPSAPPQDRKPLELRRWSQVSRADAPAPAKAEEPTMKEKPMAQEPAVPRPTSEDSGPSGADEADLIRLLSEKGQLKEVEAAAQLKVDAKTLRVWLDGLSQNGAVEVKRHLFGGADIALKEGADVAAILDDLHSRKIREELRRIREAR